MTLSHHNGWNPRPFPPAHETNPDIREPIAIVGIGCRLPGGAGDPEAFWRLLSTGTDAITAVPADRWNAQSFFDPDPAKPGKTYSRWGGFVEDLDRFDPHAFGISPREAARMDPQQRMLLEVAWHGLEDAGLPLEKVSGSKTAVFVGISSFDYSVLETSFRDRANIDVYSNTGGSLSIAANRISYCFDLRGPSAAVDTACSSALVAVHLACQSIWRDGCSLALAGGVNALLLPDWYVGFCRMGMLSPEGRCRAFDSRASGFVRSEGAGLVVLKPLSQAIADGDRIYALIRGTAMNQDGRTPGMTMPSQEAQAALVRQACRNAGILPAQIQYVEAHGTGTLVGDPIEARALGEVLSEGRSEGDPCLIGSVKTNIGHLEAGAGIAGLIKLALALHHHEIPASLHFEQPNPEIDFPALRLRVPTRREPWPASDGPATAGINSFGFGGTNAHAILQEAPRVVNQTSGGCDSPRAWLVPISARSPEALRAASGRWAEFVSQGVEDLSLADLAASAALRRTHHDHRLTVVAHSIPELAECLSEFAAGRAPAGVSEGKPAPDRQPRLAFVCSGQGPQWWAMGRQLLNEEPLFRAMIERCDAIVRQLGNWSLLDELNADEASSRMDVTAISQPCIFALQVALAELWAAWGIRPEAVLGHSVGEVAAAYLAGAFSLEDAVRVIFHRGRCMELASARGRMLAAALSAQEAQDLAAPYGERLALAAVNSPTSATLSGESGPLEEIAARLEERGIFHRFLKVRYAFHSAQMDPIRDELLEALQEIQPGRAALPLISTVTGDRVEGPELGPEYWWRNVRQTVRFADGIDRLIEAGCDTLVELSPHPVLAAAISECYADRGQKVAVLASLRRKDDERATMLQALGALHVLGQPIHWKGIVPRKRRFVALPTYPWHRERYWHEAEESRTSRLMPPAHPLLGISQDGPRPAWESRLDLKLAAYLADHRVQRATILPATAYIELALAAAREALGPGGYELREIKLANPCFLAPEKPLRLQTSFDADDASILVHTRPIDGNHGWTPHLTATARVLAAEPEAAEFSPATVQARCPSELSPEDCYNYLHEIGLDYGPMFHGIVRAWRGARESLGLVRLPEALREESDPYLFHPALLDACLQVVIPAAEDFNEPGGGLFLPHEIEQVRWHGRPGQSVWVHARLLEKTSHRSVADVDLYDESGALIAQIRNLRSQRVAGGGNDSLEHLLYAYQWQMQPRPQPPAESAPGHWLVFADKGGVGARLAELLRTRGNHCSLIYASTRFDDCAGDCYRVQPESRTDLERLLQSIGAPCQGVVHLWNLDAPPAAELDLEAATTAQRPGLFSIVALVQAWEQVLPDQSAGLFIVTRGAQSVRERPEEVAIFQSPAIGLGRVIASEYPRLRSRLVDLDPLATEADARMLLDEVLTADDEDEVALRGSDRFVHRLVPSPTATPAEIEPPQPGVPYRLCGPQPGTLDGLVLQAHTRRTPGPGEVEIEVYAAGLNFSDVMKALGLYPGQGDGPLALGAECSGRVAAVGADVSRFRVGDEVLAVAPFAFGSHAVTRAELVAHKPARLSFEEAATLPIAFLTAAYALEHLGRLSQGESVLIHSASGGVGLAAIQLAHCAGARIFATAGTPEKREYLRTLGIDDVMDSRSLAFADQVRERTQGRGVDVILNSLPGEAIPRGLAALADYGRFLEIGKRDIYQNARLHLEPFRNNLSFFAIDLDRVMREKPALLGRLLQDIVARVDSRELEPLPLTAWPISDVVAAFRHMQHGKHIGKVVVTVRDQPVAAAPAHDEPVSLRADGTYLITGGLGGFGLAVARWMAERGAGALVLLGRRGAHTPEAQDAVRDLERLGTRVLVRSGDVANQADLAAVLAETDRDLPRLCGVVHAAMVLEDALLTNLDHDLMDRVLAPKLAGTWNLQQQTKDRPLELFIMFSSLSSVFGHAGQGNYAAANAFLDAMAWYRRAQDLPALTINWGYLAEVGYLARRAELGERLERQGVLSFSVRQALALLERAIQQNRIQMSVMRVEWSRWRGLGVASRISPRFAHLCASAESRNGSVAAGSTHGRQAILAAAPEERPGLLEALLRNKVARVLGTSPERLDGEKSLLHLGLDSLMAVELRNWIETELDVNLPIVELMRSPCISHVSTLLLDLLAKPDTHQTSLPERNGAAYAAQNGHAASAEAILANVDELSSDQVDAMLSALLSEKHNGSASAPPGNGMLHSESVGNKPL